MEMPGATNGADEAGGPPRHVTVPSLPLALSHPHTGLSAYPRNGRTQNDTFERARSGGVIFPARLSTLVARPLLRSVSAPSHLCVELLSDEIRLTSHDFFVGISSNFPNLPCRRDVNPNHQLYGL